MNRPEWKNAPEWAKYLAMDENEAWYWYEYKPRRDSDNERWVKVQGRQAYADNPDDVEWDVSLERRPK